MERRGTEDFKIVQGCIKGNFNYKNALFIAENNNSECERRRSDCFVCMTEK